MLGDVATATASDWFRLTRQIGTKQLKTQVRLPVGGGRRVQVERLPLVANFSPDTADKIFTSPVKVRS